MTFTESTTASSLLALRRETAPAFGSGKLDAKADALFATLSHLFPLIIYFWKRGESPAVAAHGKEALNFALSLVLYILPISFVSAFLGATVAFVVGLLLSLVSFAAFALVIFGAWECHQGILLRYPLNLRLLK